MSLRVLVVGIILIAIISLLLVICFCNQEKTKVEGSVLQNYRQYNVLINQFNKFISFKVMDEEEDAEDCCLGLCSVSREQNQKIHQTNEPYNEMNKEKKVPSRSSSMRSESPDMRMPGYIDINI